mgnify:CR=1 FL=1
MNIAVTEEIALTEFRLSDRADCVERIGDREIYEHTLRIPHPYTPEHFDQWLEIVDQVNPGLQPRSVTLSPDEKALYNAVTEYVRTEFNRADQLASDQHRGTVGFALTILQRRLASSPAAIYHSLRRRRERLEARLARMPRPEALSAQAAQKLDDLAERLRRGLADRASKARERLQDDAARLSVPLLRARIGRAQDRLDAYDYNDLVTNEAGFGRQA